MEPEDLTNDTCPELGYYNPHPYKLLLSNNFNNILPPSLGRLGGFFPSGLLTKILVHISGLSHLCYKPAHLNLLDFII
jgi:hypothetical protein